MLLFMSVIVFAGLGNNAFAQKTLMSPQPPLSALSTSLPPQQSLLPPAPSGLALKQGYFQGKDGVQLFYRMVGDGKDTVVWVHGGPGLNIGNGALENEILAARGYTFVSYDQRSGGRSELVRDTNKLHMIDHVQDLEALRQHLHIEKLTLIGLSWGAAILTYYANRFPQNVKRFVFFSPMPPNTEYAKRRSAVQNSIMGPVIRKQRTEAFNLIDSAKDENLPELMVKAFETGNNYTIVPTNALPMIKSVFAISPLAIRISRSVHSVRRALGDPWDFRPLLTNIHVPTLVIEGEKTTVPLDATREYVKQIKGAKLVLIPNAGHETYADQPEAFLDALDAFFKSTRQ